MGLWDSFCSGISSVASSISSGVSRAVSAVGNAVSRVGGWVSDTATKILQTGVEMGARIIDKIRGVGVETEVLNPDETMEEVGDRAMRSEHKPENFDSYNTYINHLRKEVPFDKKDLTQLDESQLLARRAVGAAITLKAVNEKLDTVMTPEFMAIVDKQNLAASQIIATAKVYKEQSLKLEDYSLYLDGELSIDETSKHSNALVCAYQKLEPELSIEQIEDKVMSLRVY